MPTNFSFNKVFKLDMSDIIITKCVTKRIQKDYKNINMTVKQFSKKYEFSTDIINGLL